MKRSFLCFVVVTAIGVSAFMVGRFALAAGPAAVGFGPASSTLTMGAPPPVPTVDITVANVVSPPGLGGYTVGLSFNPSVVTLTSLTDAGIFSGGANVVVCSTPTITASSARASCATVPFFGTPAPGIAVGSTPVPLMHAAFSPVGPGTSPLGLTATVNGTPVVTALKNPSGTPIAAALSSGSITVQSSVASVGGVAAQISIDTLPAAPARRSGAAVTIIVLTAAGSLAMAAAALWLRRVRPDR